MGIIKIKMFNKIILTIKQALATFNFDKTVLNGYVLVCN